MARLRAKYTATFYFDSGEEPPLKYKYYNDNGTAATWSGTATPEISSRYILRRAPPATHLNHPLISRRKESYIDKSLKIRQPGIDRKVSLSAPAPRVKNTCMWRRRAAYARPNATHRRRTAAAPPPPAPRYSTLYFILIPINYIQQ